jgi:hypothetical protein
VSKARNASAAVKQKRYRTRVRNGTMPVMVEVDGGTLNVLVALGWRADQQADDKRAIGRAITALLADVGQGGRYQVTRRR